MSEKTIRVILVDDEESLRLPLKQRLEEVLEYQVDAVSSGQEALELVDKNQGNYDVAIIDHFLIHGLNGIQVMHEMKGRFPNIECIIFTGWGSEQRQQALQAGAFRYIEKPFDFDELAVLIRTAAQQVRLRAITQIILSERDPEKVLNEVVKSARSLASAEKARIVLIDSNITRAPNQDTEYPVNADKNLFLIENNLSGEIIRSGLILSIPDVHQDPRFDPHLITSKIKSLIGVPIPGEGRYIGVLYVYSKTSGHFDDWGIKTLLQTLAGQIGLALTNSQAFAQIQKHAGYMEALVRASRRLTEAIDLEDQLVIAWDFVREQLNIAMFYVALFEGKTRKLSFPLAFEQGKRVHVPDRYLTKDEVLSISDYVVKTGQEIAWSTLEDGQKIGASIGLISIQIGNPSAPESAIHLPLKTGDDVIGVISIQSVEQFAFPTVLLDAYRALGSQLTVAIEKSAFLKQVLKLRNEAQIVAQVTVLGDLPSTIKSVIRAVRDVMQCDLVTLYQFEEGAQRLTPMILDQQEQHFYTDFSKTTEHSSVVWRILNLEEPYFYYTEDVTKDPLLHGNFSKRENIKSALSIVLRFEERRVGVMFINYRSSHRFGSDELSNALLLANLAAVAIWNSQLFEEINRRARALQALYEAGKIVTSSLALDEILTHIVEESWRLASRYTNAQLCNLMLLENDRLIVTAAYPSKHLPFLRKQIGEIKLKSDPQIGIFGRAVLTGKSQLVKDVKLDVDYINYDSETRSELAIPLTIENKIIGVINIEHPEYGALDTEDVRTLEALAAQAAIAIRNAQAYKELSETKGLVGARTAVAWMGMASSAWRHAIDSLAITITEQIELLNIQLSKVSSPDDYSRIRERIAIIQRAAKQILDKPITPPLSNETGLRSVLINAIVEERANQLWSHDPYKKVTLRLDLGCGDNITVRASPEWLRRAFDILLDNAIEAVIGSNQSEITIGTRDLGSDIEIFIIDTGPGIPDEIRSRIGKEAIEKPEDAKGLGMGLLMAQTIVQTYGGEIRVDSTGPKGTCMIIKLPKESILTQEIRIDE